MARRSKRVKAYKKHEPNLSRKIKKICLLGTVVELIVLFTKHYSSLDKARILFMPLPEILEFINQDKILKLVREQDRPSIQAILRGSDNPLLALIEQINKLPEKTRNGDQIKKLKLLLTRSFPKIKIDNDGRLHLNHTVKSPK